MTCICVGPKRAGKTHLLKALQRPGSVDETSFSSPTLGTSIYNIAFPRKLENLMHENSKPLINSNGTHTHSFPHKSVQILEIGGSVASLWRQYYDDVYKLIYVVDTSNLCQISNAGILLYSLVTEPLLQQVKILLVLTKMDYAYRQMRNEVLLMLQVSKLQKQIQQSITTVEASSVTNLGLKEIYDWLQQP